MAAISFAAAALTVTASAAGATTIGQLAPGTPTGFTYGAGGSPGVDAIQPTVTSGNSYVVPPSGATITSWSTNAAVGGGQLLQLKVFRPVLGFTFMVVGHDTPRILGGGAVNTFPTNIAVKPGDLVGINNQNGSAVNNADFFSAPGETGLVFGPGGNPSDGTSETFMTPFSTYRLNLTAEVAPLTTGLRAAALKKCKHKHSHKKRKKCKKKANLLPV